MVTPQKLFGTALYLLLWPALLLLLGGDAGWVAGWLFGVWYLGLCGSVIGWLYLENPALLEERYRRPGSGGQEGWDRWMVALLAAGFTAWIAVMPLDARRYRWTPPLPLSFQVAGAALLAPSWWLFLRSFQDNAFLSPLVRIQAERAHEVVSTGVYGIVRHPMYLAAVLMFLGAPLLLGSWLGLVVGGALSLLLAMRIVGEERLLARDLAGYEAYRRKVRARLVPFVW